MESRERRRRRQAKSTGAKEGGESEEGNEYADELIYQLSHFFHLLAFGTTASKLHASYRSPRHQIRKRLKEPLTQHQSSAVADFMKRSEEGMAMGDDWKRLVQTMREMNRVNYQEVLGKVLGESCRQSLRESVVTVDGAIEDGVEAVDPTQFYKHLESYTSALAESHMKISPIATGKTGDATTVFRSLLQAIEHSLTKETERVKSLCEIIEIETWNNENISDAKQKDRETKRYERLKRLLQSLSKVSSAMEEWRGNLSSRIVGTATFEGLTTSAEKAEGIRILTTRRRTKKDGGIERVIPVPFAVPVILQQSQPQSQPRGDNEPAETGRQYYPSLTESLYSVTIEPNPIRGYDWRGLIKRGKVIQETFIRRVNLDGNDVEMNNVQKEKTIPDGMAVGKIQEKQSCDSVSMSSRTIGIQATDWREMEGDVILIPRGVAVGGKSNVSVQTESAAGRLKVAKAETAELVDEAKISHDRTENASSSVSRPKQAKTVTTKASQDPTLDSAPASNSKQVKSETTGEAKTNKDLRPKKPSLVGQKAVYAAAVAAIAKNKRRSKKIMSLQNNKKVSNNETSPGVGTISGMEVGDAKFELISHADDDSEGPRRISSLDLPLLNCSGSVKSHLSSDSESAEQSTVDSKVSGVKDSDGEDSSMTHSSAIDTPSDIDDLSLGSFTDSSEEASRKERDVIPVRDDEPEQVAKEEQEVIPLFDDEPEQVASDNKAIDSSDRMPDLSERSNPITEVMAQNDSTANISDMVDSDSSSSTSSSDDSSTTSSSSGTSSSSTSSDDEESSYSSSSEENLSNNISESAMPPPLITNTPSSNDANKIEWVTRKETRFCHPLPQSLIFHLKRFEYSNALGRVENLNGELDIPEELDLKPCCSDTLAKSKAVKACCYRYSLSGAIVHVDPIEDEAEKVYGEATEGHFVTFIKNLPSDTDKSSGSNNNQWFEMDDDEVHLVDKHTCNIVQEASAQSLSGNQLALKILSGCNVVSFTEESQPDRERKYATLVVYSRICDCPRLHVLSDS